ncbi:alpha/beta hydrolase [Acetobacteraceae bacterium KSS8]|uniref:Alpha/beta hydrolase n=1 Tax=Endosaccharibacter trunci TaxID=2812733 RepID=A0ABT1WAX0_9PROT|nr:alpha/beta hydrolase [Acetobacteraceae bacterium KSS8]
MQVGTFFPGFHYEEMTLSGTRYRLRTGGLAGWQAEPLLLLHGQPQTHAMWHRVAPALSDRFAVVCADLPAHLTIAELAHDMLALMSRLGHRRFSVAGHDFGAHVAARVARDAPDRVDRLAIVEAVPLLDHAGRRDLSFELGTYPGCWFGQHHPKPESLTVTAPDEWFRLVAPDENPEIFHPEAVVDYLLEGPWNEDLRGFGAAADGPVPTLDLSQRLDPVTISCPTLVIWGTRGRIGGWYDPRTLWRRDISGPIEGGSVESGHFVPEEASWELAERFRAFFAPDQTDP